MIQSFGVDRNDVEQIDQLRVARRAGDETGPARQGVVRGSMDQARGQVAKAEADIERLKQNFARRRELERNRRLRSRREGHCRRTGIRRQSCKSRAAKATLALGQSCAGRRRADLEEATANLGYTTIRSPVKGIILDRRINIGQTVVANLNAPSLFLIAKDLSRLEIWSSVNETDIGSIHEGQAVRFTVSSFRRRGSRARSQRSGSMPACCRTS